MPRPSAPSVRVTERADALSSRVRLLASPLAAGALVAAVTLALHLRDPHRPGAWGWCPTRLVTGFDCPACGGLRAVNDLTHLDLAGALSSNLVVVLLIPMAVALWGRRLIALWRDGANVRPLDPPVWLWWVAGALVVAFTVVRNVPGNWLAA